MRQYGTYGRLLAEHLQHWADTGETPTAHVTVGKVEGVEIKRCVRDAPRAALQNHGGREATEYTILACQIELARRGPPSGWSAPWYGVRGWLCFDAKEGWRPILAGQE